jgi:hypothetical protein
MNSNMANIVIKAVDNATPTLKKVGKGFGALSKAGKAVGSGLQTAAVGALGIATAVAGFTVAAVAAAADEEKQIARLNGVLKTRGMLTDANTAAIETQTTKLEELAFSDDAVRESLITATAFTKNFNDALSVQNVAADVAAARNISLEEATALVGKAYQGNTKGLKGLGVQVKKGAKDTEILAAITKKYGGSAAAAANTVSGKFTRAQNTVNNIMEDFGAKFLPIAADGLDFINKTILPGVSAGLDALAPIVQDIGGKLVNAFGPIIQDNITNLTKPGGVFDSVGKVVGPIFEMLGEKVGKFIGVLTGPDGLLTSIGTIVGALWGDGNGPLAFAVNAIGASIGVLFDIITGVVTVIGNLVKGIADFLTASGEADAYQKALDKKNADAMNPGGDFGKNFALAMGAGPYGGGFIIPTIATAPAYTSGATLGTSYGTPEFKVYVGQKEFDATVKDSVGGMLRDTGR